MSRSLESAIESVGYENYILSLSDPDLPFHHEGGVGTTRKDPGYSFLSGFTDPEIQAKMREGERQYREMQERWQQKQRWEAENP